MFRRDPALDLFKYVGKTKGYIPSRRGNITSRISTVSVKSMVRLAYFLQEQREPFDMVSKSRSLKSTGNEASGGPPMHRKRLFYHSFDTGRRDRVIPKRCSERDPNDPERGPINHPDRNPKVVATDFSAIDRIVTPAK